MLSAPAVLVAVAEPGAWDVAVGIGVLAAAHGVVLACLRVRERGALVAAELLAVFGLLAMVAAFIPSLL